jgi:hypothetical protein
VFGESRFAGPGARRAGLPASAPGDAGGAAGGWAVTVLRRPACASALRVTPPFAVGSTARWRLSDGSAASQAHHAQQPGALGQGVRGLVFGYSQLQVGGLAGGGSGCKLLHSEDIFTVAKLAGPAGGPGSARRFSCEFDHMSEGWLRQGGQPPPSLAHARRRRMSGLLAAVSQDSSAPSCPAKAVHAMLWTSALRTPRMSDARSSDPKPSRPAPRDLARGRVAWLCPGCSRRPCLLAGREPLRAAERNATGCARLVGHAR